jgi:hypothetical protein|tara:strand:+ start:168 stop:407 length:240 start_codon:yes stop_codon:yes gene_type:complete
MIENFDKLNDQEISDKISKINKRIAYIEKTNMYTSSLPQLRMMKASLVMEATSRIEKIKNDIVQQRAFPNESKIIGEDD